MIILICPYCESENVTVCRADEKFTSFECEDCGEIWTIDIFEDEYKED